jgi:hypothetical protein
MSVTVPTAAPLDLTALGFLALHLEKIAEIADDLRRCVPPPEPALGELVVRLGLHAAGARAEFATLCIGS